MAKDSAPRVSLHPTSILTLHDDSIGTVRAAWLGGALWFSSGDVYSVLGLCGTGPVVKNLPVEHKRVAYFRENGAQHSLSLTDLAGVRQLAAAAEDDLMGGRVVKWLYDSETGGRPSQPAKPEVAVAKPPTEHPRVIDARARFGAAAQNAEGATASMDNLQVFKHSEFGELDVIMIDGKPYFPATDCAKILGYTNPRKAVSDHCDHVTKRDVVSKTTNQYGATTEQVVQKSYIPEGDLYRLIIRSKLPAAERFERWVFDDVLPTIRKHGVYATPEMLYEFFARPENLARTFHELYMEQTARKQLEKQIEADAPKVAFADMVGSSEDTIMVKELAHLMHKNGLNIGQNRLYARLREDGFVCSAPGERYNLPTQRALNAGLLSVCETAYNKGGATRVVCSTRVTSRGQRYFLDRYVGDAAEGKGQ